MIEKNKLPDFVRVIADDYLSLLLPHTHYDYLVLLVLYGASKILCTNRVQIDNDTIKANSTFPNLYVMSIADSGTGKDKSKNILKNLMSDYYENFEAVAERMKQEKLKEIEEYIAENGLKKSQASDYRETHRPRNLWQKIDSRATNEGFMETRLALQEVGYGCTYWEDSEIYGALPSLSKENSDFIEYLFEAYDLGFSSAKIIKGNSNPKNVSAVPHLSSLHGSLNENVNSKIFKAFFDSGFARRSLFFYQENRVYKRAENSFEMAERALKSEKYCKNLFKELDEKTRQKPQILYPHNCKKISLETEVEKIYYNYDESCKEEASKVHEYGTLGIKLEIEGRAWKVLKLAGIISVINSGSQPNYVITKKEWDQAVYIVEHFSQYFKLFYGLSSESLEESVTKLIIKSGEISKTNLIKSNLFKGGYSQKQHEFNTLMKSDSFKEYLASQDLILIKEASKFHKNSQVYKIEKIPEHGSETSCDQIEVEFSQGETNRDNDTAMYHTATKFNELHLETKKPVKYSPAIFKDNYRKKANWLGGDQMIVFDFDNECKEESQATIEHIQTRFKDFTHLISTTRNHNKDKKGHGVRQRFRLFLPLSSPLNIKAEEYSDLMEKVAKKMFIDVSGWVDIPAAKDVARVYSGNPNQEHFYNDGRLMSWEVYNRTVDLRSFDEKQPKNAIDEHVVLEVKGQSLGLHQAVELAKMKGKVPCKAYCHEDKAPSAFFCINNNGNFQYYCSSCGISKFYNL